MSFLSLPFELREQIYKLCLEADLNILVPTKTFPRSRHGRLGKTFDGRRYEAVQPPEEEERIEWNIPYRSLALTCRTLAEDLKALTYDTWECTMTVRPITLTWNRLSGPDPKKLIVNWDWKGTGFVFGGDGGFHETTNVVFDIFRYFHFHGPTLRGKGPIYIESMEWRHGDLELFSETDLRVLAQKLTHPMFRHALGGVTVQAFGRTWDMKTNQTDCGYDYDKLWAENGFVWEDA